MISHSVAEKIPKDTISQPATFGQVIALIENEDDRFLGLEALSDDLSEVPIVGLFEFKTQDMDSGVLITAYNITDTDSTDFKEFASMQREIDEKSVEIESGVAAASSHNRASDSIPPFENLSDTDQTKRANAEYSSSNDPGSTVAWKWNHNDQTWSKT